MHEPKNLSDEIYKYVSRKTFFFSLFAVCAFCVLCMLTAIMASNDADTQPLYIEASASPTTFLIKNVDGRVAICDAYDGIPYELLDVSVSALPEAEKLALDIGVYVNSVSELLTLIEAYTS